jgi:hypothetical protein
MSIIGPLFSMQYGVPVLLCLFVFIVKIYKKRIINSPFCTRSTCIRLKCFASDHWLVASLEHVYTDTFTFSVVATVKRRCQQIRR